MSPAPTCRCSLRCQSWCRVRWTATTCACSATGRQARARRSPCRAQTHPQAGASSPGLWRRWAVLRPDAPPAMCLWCAACPQGDMGMPLHPLAMTAQGALCFETYQQHRPICCYGTPDLNPPQRLLTLPLPCPRSWSAPPSWRTRSGSTPWRRPSLRSTTTR